MSTAVGHEVKSLIDLQLAGAAVNQNGMVSIRQLYSNIKKFTDIDIDYAQFLECIEDNRAAFNVRDGEIGVDVNYIKL